MSEWVGRIGVVVGLEDGSGRVRLPDTVMVVVVMLELR